MPSYGKRAPLRNLQGLEHGVSDQQAMVIAWNHGLARIVVDGTVQPDPELLGELLRSRCGELHEVRLTGRRDHIWLRGTLSLYSRRTRLDSGLSLGYGF